MGKFTETIKMLANGVRRKTIYNQWYEFRDCLINFKGDTTQVIQLDGVYLIGDLDAGNYVSVGPNGIYLYGEATVWRDENAGGTLLLLAAANQPSRTAIDGTSIIGWGYSASALNEQHWSTELQHDYKEGTNLIAHFHVTPDTASAGDVLLKMDYWIKKNGVAAVTGTLSTLLTVAAGDQWDELRKNFDTQIDGSTLGIASQCHFRFYRDAADASDTYAGKVVVNTIGYHYEVDNLGSREITTK